ncbi:MAG: Rrf2 family transcriptional regulator [bacterium]|nr:Rrf2 family transcriptional regulator [bacterium]
MRISSKGRYGLRAMIELARLDLARQAKNGQGRGLINQAPTSVKSVSEKQCIPMAYLERIFHDLNIAGLVESVRGPGGGYKLKKPLKKIKVGDILYALEGPIKLSNCVPRGETSTGECDRINNCVARVVWNRLSKEFSKILNDMSLQDILDEYKQRGKDG